MNQRIKAIVLAKRKYREYDELVWLYTENYGILSAIIHGVKRKRSKYKGELSLFSVVYVDVKIKTGLSTIYDFEILKQSINEKNIFLGYTYGSQISELLRRVLPEKEAISGMFNLIETLLLLLDKLAYPNLAVAFLQQKILVFTGSQIVLERCVICQKQTNIVAYSYFHHGLICQTCQSYVMKTDLVDDQLLKLLVAFSRLDVNKLEQLQLDLHAANFISQFWQHIYEQDLGIVLKSQKVLASMEKLAKEEL